MPDACGRRMWRRVAQCVALAVGSAAGCAPGGSLASHDTLAATVSGLDSIVLERTVCFGLCPAYRVRISGSGQVDFAPTNPRDSAMVPRSDSISPNMVSALLKRARDIDFFTLPDAIDPAHPEVCRLAATDHPSAIVTIALTDTVKRVNHYLGCAGERNAEPVETYVPLKAFEAAIDRAVRVDRWLPNRE